jgi:hypothetical protein
MHSTSLDAFVARVRQSRRMTYADLCRLKRDVLPDGLTSKADAEALLSIDHGLEHADRSWPENLARLLTSFLFEENGSRQLGAGRAEWLGTQLARCRPATARQVRRAIVREARVVDPSLTSVLGGRASPKKRRTPLPSQALQWPPPSAHPSL